MADVRTQLRTRFGHLMERLTGIALTKAGFTYRFDWQYDDTCISPDYTLPDSDSVNVLMEVTQTDSRDSLRMKSLRYLELIAEAKIHFGSALVCVSTIYGTPGEDLQETFLQASLSPFDAALVPRNDTRISLTQRNQIEDLEGKALSLASKTAAVEKALASLKTHPGVDALAAFFRKAIPAVKANAILRQVWDLESTRSAKSPPSEDLAPITSSHKKGLLEALFLSDDSFNKLCKYLESARPGKQSEWPKDVKTSLLEAGLATERPSISGPRLILKPEISGILGSEEGMRCARLTRKALSTAEGAKWYFEDIRDPARRVSMAKKYLAIIAKGKSYLEKAVFDNLVHSVYDGVSHSRCWVAECVAMHLGVSQSELDNRITRDPEFNARFSGRLVGCPFRDVAMKFAAIMTNQDRLRDHAYFIAKLHSKLIAKSIDAATLATTLGKARRDNSVKLKHLNPLMLVVSDTFAKHGWSLEVTHVPSLIFDLMNDAHAGRFSVHMATKGKRRVVLNALQIIDAHKPKEWAARGRAIRYRIVDDNGKISVVEQLKDAHFVFVLDGKVNVKMRTMLEKAGWITCALDELEGLMGTLG